MTLLKKLRRLFAKQRKDEAAHIVKQLLIDLGQSVDEPQKPTENSTAIPVKPPCPDVLVATQSCVCIGCTRVGKCSLEAMSRAAGCLHSFPAYCSLHDRDKSYPTHGFGERFVKEWQQHLYKKFDIPDTSPTPVVGVEEKETQNGKEEGKSTRTELSGGQSEESGEYLCG